MVGLSTTDTRRSLAAEAQAMIATHLRAHQDALNCSEPKGVMDQQPGRIPSVGCLLYLAADQIIPQRPFISRARVPCKRVWVHSPRLDVTILAASYLSLRDSGHLRLMLYEVTDVTLLRRRPWMTTEVAAIVMDAAPPPGLLRAVLKLASARTFVPTSNSDLRKHLKDLRGRSYFSLLEAAKDELVELGYAEYRGVFFRPVCRRLATLDRACADAIRWWRTVEATEAPLFNGPWRACWEACKYEGGGG